MIPVSSNSLFPTKEEAIQSPHRDYLFETIIPVSFVEFQVQRMTFLTHRVFVNSI